MKVCVFFLFFVCVFDSFPLFLVVVYSEYEQLYQAHIPYSIMKPGTPKKMPKKKSSFRQVSPPMTPARPRFREINSVLSGADSSFEARDSGEIAVENRDSRDYDETMGEAKQLAQLLRRRISGRLAARDVSNDPRLAWPGALHFHSDTEFS